MSFWMLLKNNPFFIVYVIALILSVLNYYKYFDSVLKYFPILIGYTTLTELLGLLLRENDEFIIIYSEGYEHLNALIFNIFDVLFFLYFLFIYWKVLENKKHKKSVKHGVLFFIIVSIINLFFQNFFLEPQVYSMLIGSFCITTAAILYLKQINGFTGNNKRKLLSWVSLGLLIFYPFYPIIFFIVSYCDNKLYRLLHLDIFHQTLICLMYSCFIIGFLKMHPMKSVQNEA